MNCQEGMQDDFYLLTGWPFFLPISGSGGSGNAGQDLSDLQPPTERSDRSSALLHSRIQPSQSHCCAEPIQIHRQTDRYADRQTDRYADRHTHTDRSSALLHSRKQPLPCNKPDFNLVLTFLIAYYSWGKAGQVPWVEIWPGEALRTYSRACFKGLMQPNGQSLLLAISYCQQLSTPSLKNYLYNLEDSISHRLAFLGSQNRKGGCIQNDREHHPVANISFTSKLKAD